MEKKFKIELTEEQVKVILGLIDDHSGDAPDFFLNEKGRVITPMLDPEYEGYDASVQDHLNLFLSRDKLDY